MFVIVLIPGPGTFAIASKSLTHNISSVAFIILGMVIADIIFLWLAIFGLNTLATVLGDFFVLIKYLGAAYLIFLGYKLFFSKTSMDKEEQTQTNSWSKNFLIGFVITFSNPKVILFYLSLLPALVNIHTLQTSHIALLTLSVTFVICTVMFGYAFMAFKAKRLLQTPQRKRNMNKIAGAVMVTAGGTLMLKA
jgi:threonine/homoserine/homoserine lactone efflux protein